MGDDIYLSTKPRAGTKVIPNPKNIAPKLDTDNPDLPKHRFVDMNVSNPPTSDLIPKHPVEDIFTMKGIRQTPGHSVPKDHPAVQVSEN